ncbi:MAG: aminotransferase class IV, partial [Thermoleophilaceae bacterium]
MTAPQPRGSGVVLIGGGVTPVIAINGQVVDPAIPHLSALDRGFTLADGLFETMRAYGGVIFRLDQHLARLERGASALRLFLPPPLRAMVLNTLRAAVDQGLRDASVRLTVSRGPGAPGVAPPPDAHPTVVIAVHPLPPFPASLYGAGLSAETAVGRRNEHAVTAGLKTLSYTDAMVALAEARAGGNDDAIFLDTAGHVSEATSSNVFIARDRTLVTPPTSCGVLPGITRQAVLELAADRGVTAEERPLQPDEVHAASEAFLTSSVREIVPLVRVDGRLIGDGTPGD